MNSIMTFEKSNLPKIILTGACGFVGSAVSQRLFESGYELVNIDDLSFGNLKNLSGNNKLNYRFRFEKLTEQDLQPFDILIHCATSNIIYAIDKPIETFQNNATNTIKLFQKFKGRIIYTSTASVYGQADVIPTPEDAEIRTNNAYDQSKYIAELFLQQRGNYTTLRLSNVYGPNQRADNPFCGVMGRFLDNILKNQTIKINGEGSQTRDYTFVDDVVDAIMLTLEKPALNTEINIATGKETSILNLIETMLEVITPPEFEIERIPQRKIDGIMRRALNIEKAKLLLGWQPKTSLEEGIKKTVEWMREKIIL